MRLYLFFLVLIPQLSQAQLFSEVSEEVGMNYRYEGNEFQMAGGGLMVIDVNNDGWEDIYQCGSVFDSKLWINKKGYFSDATSNYGLDVLNGYFIQGAVSADFDNDGFQDFFVANFGAGLQRGDKKSPVLLHNVEGLRFEPIYLDSLLPPAYYSSATLGDFNNDGFSDIYITNYLSSMGELMNEEGTVTGYVPSCFENKLLMNLHGNGFVECAAEYGLNDPGCGLSAQFTDLDGDNDLDLLLLNDFGMWTRNGNRIFRNNYPEKSFTDISDEIGFNHQMYGMGFGPGDYDNDGDVDYYVTNIGENYLFNRDGENLKNVANELKIDAPFVRDTIRGTSWSGLFFDMDFDSDLDLFVSRGNVAVMVPKTAVSDPNKLYKNHNGNFKDISAESGLSDRLSHRGSVVLDFDHDGDLDIISNVVKMPWVAFAGADQKIKVYRNDQKAGNWIGIILVGNENINADCFGCSVTFENDTIKQTHSVDGGSGHASQSTRILYFGLGKAKKLPSLTVDWSNGETSRYEKLKAGNIYKVDSILGLEKIR